MWTIVVLMRTRRLISLLTIHRHIRRFSCEYTGNSPVQCYPHLRRSFFLHHASVLTTERRYPASKQMPGRKHSQDYVASDL